MKIIASPPEGSSAIKHKEIIICHGRIGFAYSAESEVSKRRGVWIRYDSQQESASFYQFSDWKKFGIYRADLTIGVHSLKDYPDLLDAVLMNALKRRINLDTEFELVETDGRLLNLVYKVSLLNEAK